MYSYILLESMVMFAQLVMKSLKTVILNVLLYKLFISDFDCEDVFFSH